MSVNLKLVDTERHLITGGNPEERYPVPPKDEIDGDFAEAQDLQEIARAIVASDLAKFAAAERREIVYLWKAKGGQSSGKLRLGQCQKASGLVAHFSEAAWVIWIAADHVRDLGLTRWEVEAAVYHELLHISEDVETCKPAINPHDAEMFAAEIEQYGLWKSDLRFVAKSFSQLPLWDVEEASN